MKDFICTWFDEGFWFGLIWYKFSERIVVRFWAVVGLEVLQPVQVFFRPHSILTPFFFHQCQSQFLVKSLLCHTLRQVFSQNSQPLFLHFWWMKNSFNSNPYLFRSSSKFEKWIWWKMSFILHLTKDLVISWFDTSLIKGLTFPFCPFFHQV